MSETFKYPNATSPTKTLTFETESGGTGGHLITDGEEINFNQIKDKTIGGVLMVKTLGDHSKSWEYTVIIPISSESYTDYDDILSFFGTSYANGAENTFVWTDYASVARTVNMISGLKVNTISGTMKKVNMILEESNT
ncbi:MAG: hypothetical protein ABIA63_09290 [bacterium]